MSRDRWNDSLSKNTQHNDEVVRFFFISAHRQLWWINSMNKCQFIRIICIFIDSMLDFDKTTAFRMNSLTRCTSLKTSKMNRHLGKFWRITNFPHRVILFSIVHISWNFVWMVTNIWNVWFLRRHLAFDYFGRVKDERFTAVPSENRVLHANHWFENEVKERIPDYDIWK